MAKNTTKTMFVCGECGYESAKWLGRCPACDSWNTMVEAERISAPDAARPAALPMSAVSSGDAKRVSTRIGELDRVLGGGVVAGSTILLGGDPGIGKSTLLIQTASSLTDNGKVLYVTGEESAAQLKLRAERLGLTGDMLLLAETDITVVEAEFTRTKPDYLIIDSIQTMYCPELSGAQGSVSQVRECTAILTRIAKTSGAAVFIVGHVTKEGAIAGPRILEHMVDTVLYFEGDRYDVYRLLRAVKNRYGATSEIGVFEMRDTGMMGVDNPEKLFLSGSDTAGCAVTCALTGARPMLVEVQSLVSPSPFNNPRRMAAGLDSNRLSLLLAVLEKRAGVQLYDKDVYCNVVGGIRLDERGGDLAIALCVASAIKEAALPASTAVLGEIALTGEIRPVARMDKRISECVRLGYSTLILPPCDAPAPGGARLITVRTLADAVKHLNAK